MYLFQAGVLFRKENKKFVAILIRVYALFGELFTGLNDAVAYQKWHLYIRYGKELLDPQFKGKVSVLTTGKPHWNWNCENWHLCRGEWKAEIIQNCQAWILRNFKTVWQGESGELKTVCWFFQILSVELPKLFVCCKLLDLTESEKDRGIFVYILFN